MYYISQLHRLLVISQNVAIIWCNFQWFAMMLWVKGLMQGGNLSTTSLQFLSYIHNTLKRKIQKL